LPSISAEEVVKLFEGDVRARKRLAELLVSEPDVRLAIINAVLRDVATKSDVEALRKELKGDIEALKAATRSDIESLKAATKSDIEALRKEFRSDIEALRAATKSDMEALRKELKGDIEALRSTTKSDMEALRKEFKSDLESLRKEFKEEMGRLDGRINGLDQRVARLEGSISFFTKLFIAFNLPLLVSVIAALVALLLRAH
jgi:DNA repair exonuclease SbcCD ATPase subunit